MSNVIIPDVAKRPRIACLLAAGNYYSAHLFQNPVLVSHTTVLSDFSECDFSGYGVRVLSGGTVQTLLDSGGRAITLWDMISWTKAGSVGNIVYGYYYLNATGQLAAVERWDLPIDMTVDGQVLQFVPQDTEGSQFLNT